MRKNIITILIIIAVLIGGYFLATSFRQVKFQSNEDVSSIAILDSEGNVIRTVTPDATPWLTIGQYQFQPQGEKVSTQPLTFNIPRGFLSITAIIDPGYSDTYLNSILSGVSETVYNSLTDTYGHTMKSYEIDNARLYGRAEWYTALLRNVESTDDSTKDFYRIIARKNDDGSWQVIYKPVLIITKEHFQNVPGRILIDINKTTPNS